VLENAWWTLANAMCSIESGLPEQIKEKVRQTIPLTAVFHLIQQIQKDYK